MSRYLAQLLGVPAPGFRLSIQQLEEASGNPAVDIRLSTDILQKTQAKIVELGLDPHDTTPDELYEVLKDRVRSDNSRLETTLQQRIGKGQISQAIVKSIESLSIPKTCFAIKHSVAKRMLKKNPPKLTMKRLGYRSLDSLLKREPAAVVFVVANYIESEAWKHRFFDDYKSLTPSDFEVREVEVYYPIRTKNWEKVASTLASQQKSSVFASKELGGVVLLPLPEHVIAGTLTTLILAIQAINDIRVHSAFCKLQQVKQDFGAIIAQSVQGSVSSLALMAGQQLPWQVIQTYYGRFSHDYPMELFEPHVHQEDLKLSEIENTISQIDPSLEFWEGTNWLGFNHNGETVSLNLRDLAVSTANNFPYARRMVSYFRESVWTELMVHYLQQKLLEDNVLQQLDAQLVEESDSGNFELNFAGA